ncbi:hypothetical protein [Latilactobacillus curvatus]|uniref:hypothetical protein n=1 Tax=Latilactobacillus curvatus TaxID=28038 RepID=UPI0023D9AA38|nr:hypothetical protein [Latilactobacillus curvatus]
MIMFIIMLAFTEKVFSNHGRRLSGALSVSGSWVIKMAAEYAVYKGDKFIDLGTADYLANKFGVPRKTIWYWTAPAYWRKNKGNSLIAIRIEDD